MGFDACSAEAFMPLAAQVLLQRFEVGSSQRKARGCRKSSPTNAEGPEDAAETPASQAARIVADCRRHVCCREPGGIDARIVHPFDLVVVIVVVDIIVVVRSFALPNLVIQRERLPLFPCIAAIRGRRVEELVEHAVLPAAVPKSPKSERAVAAAADEQRIVVENLESQDAKLEAGSRVFLVHWMDQVAVVVVVDIDL
eukprot:scaffold447_cov307-Pinguiococcus_pyrenoidosus.AAC.43